ncbi:hypothetical protein SAMN05421819_3530 [Bryocella elongata]|uniref:Uncharacterized protein n=1 Tax=Bryocella elongata TaxID=863522 RepID=A0A1H6B4W1_9BACT|nr:hypothetical protein [Bryocella elongata]SEG55889.1 hypothetical protein SAMN05421819_3530 [Bryocella elongata]
MTFLFDLPHPPISAAILAGAGLLTYAYRLTPRKKIDLVTGCLNEAAHLRTGRFEPIIEFLEEPGTAEKREQALWDAIGGMEGLKQFAEDARHIVAILQHCVEHDLVDPKHAEVVHACAKQQAKYTELALVEERLSTGTPQQRHMAAYAAVQYHWEVTYRTLAMCRVSGAPDFLLAHGALL